MQITIYVSLTSLLFAILLSLSADGEGINEPLWNYSAEDEIRHVAISDDGKYIVAGGYDNNTYFFDRTNSTPLWMYTTNARIEAVDISSDGEYIVASSYDNNIYLFTKDNNSPLWNFTTDENVKSVKISADGEFIIAGSNDDNIFVFNKNSSTPLWNYSTDDNVYSVAITKDGKYLLAGSYDGKAYLFHKENNTPLQVYDVIIDGTEIVLSVDLSADAEYSVVGVLSLSHGRWIYLFEKNSTEYLWRYQQGNPGSIAISESGEYIVSTSRSGEVSFFNRDNSTPIWTFWTDRGINSVDMTPGGKYIVVGSNDNNVYLFNNESNTPLWNYNAGGYVMEVAIAEDGDYVVAGSDDNNVYLFFNNAPPIAHIDNITPNQTEKGLMIEFKGHASDIDGNVTGYLWSSSIDGNLSTNANFTISSLSYGHHIIYFRAQDDYGAWSRIAEASVWIYGYPFAVAGENITTTVDNLVSFIGSGVDEDGNITSYEWDFDGDGIFDWYSNVTGNTAFAYNLSGEYLAVLRVTDNDNFTANATITVMVFDNPIAVIDTPLVYQFEKGSTIEFEGHGEDNGSILDSYHWKSSIDGELSLKSSFTRSDLSFGHHLIIFKVRNNRGGWSDEVDMSIWIYAKPVAHANKPEITKRTEKSVAVTFGGYGTDEDSDIVKYEWDFDGDGIIDWSSVTSGSTNFSYFVEGNYTAIFRITDNDGFTAEETVEIEVIFKESESERNLIPIVVGSVLLVSGFAGAGLYLWSKRSSVSTTPLVSQEISIPRVLVQCPGCGSQMNVPKLDRLQAIRCEKCGLEGDVKI